MGLSSQTPQEVDIQCLSWSFYVNSALCPACLDDAACLNPTLHTWCQGSVALYRAVLMGYAALPAKIPVATTAAAKAKLPTKLPASDTHKHHTSTHCSMYATCLRAAAILHSKSLFLHSTQSRQSAQTGEQYIKLWAAGCDRKHNKRYSPR